MLKDFILFIKYPYTAGVIVTIWMGTAALAAINSGVPIVKIVILNMFASVFIAFMGYRGKREI